LRFGFAGSGSAFFGLLSGRLFGRQFEGRDIVAGVCSYGYPGADLDALAAVAHLNYA